MTERDLVVIPAPKQVVWADALPEFELNADTSIMLLPDAPVEALLSAQLLQAEISQATGLHPSIVKMARPVRLSNAIVLVHDRESAAAFLYDDVPRGDALEGRGEQAHAVSIKPLTVVAGGQGTVALAYAAQTLRQITRTEGTRWSCRQVRDWPALPNRGIMLDVTRGRVPTMSTLKMLVDQMSLYKLNMLQLYAEHTFAFPHHPRIGGDCGSLSAEDMMELDSYARQRQVELIPNLNSFGHCAHVLAMPEYAHLAESDIARWSLCPVDERVFEFLDDLYGDMLPAFGSKWFNIGCDET